MHWLTIITASYFILAVSNTADKIFLSHVVTESVVYALWVSLFSILAVGVFTNIWLLDDSVRSSVRFAGDLTAMNAWDVGVAIIIGALFTGAIYLLYTALQRGEASRIIPIIGGGMPLLIYFLTVSYEPLAPSKLLSFIFLICGTVLISLLPKAAQTRPARAGIVYALAASTAFALFFVMSQYLFRRQGFINGIVWPRLGSALAVMFLLSIPHIRRAMRDSFKSLSVRVRFLWLGIQSIGALGFLGQNYVISLPGVSVALVSAMQGIQYVFILIFASALSLWRPGMLREYMSPVTIAQKLLALVLIAIGLYYVGV